MPRRSARPEKPAFRTERDSLGPVAVPADALWGAQTQRAVDNFPVSGLRMPRAFIRALGLIKAAAAQANAGLKLLDAPKAKAIQRAALAVADGQHDAQFPIDVFQTGSGTSSNMNANEVVARLATASLRRAVHPNDDVNLGQSSNDTIPTAIHVAAALELRERLTPALQHLATTIERRGRELRGVVKTGRTHLMDAMPLRFDQELSAWAQQIRNGIDRLEAATPRVLRIAQGGTAVGTGINADPRFAALFARCLSKLAGPRFVPSPNFFESLASQDAACELSGALRVIAVSLTKIANDLRWMNSGPLAGLGEIELPTLQPGSSIMPGKVNPVIPEAVCMVAAKVIGNDATITIAAQSGSFQLNVMLPLIAHDLLQSIGMLANVSRLLADKAIAGFTVRESRIAEPLSRNPVLITAANSVIGYEKGAAIAKKAYREGRPVMDVAREESGLSEARLKRLLDPAALTRGGVRGARKGGD
ncbi:fumarase class II [Panacagrimonas perspica]|uniref:Fumarate hydratase class II n=1 Tax=Panacagrimonas perspica TaxID=381431 RepID=A0A4R7PFA6_9GAMM|nr:class II fumarate hydratase [Panacagrimonas perspica]TDU32040.1 fumarase class II [Panacagrimonas perspica]THD04430.1 aspartate ammonia-lyase [Panacagrimonas perspica]